MLVIIQFNVNEKSRVYDLCDLVTSGKLNGRKNFSLSLLHCVCFPGFSLQKQDVRTASLHKSALSGLSEYKLQHKGEEIKIITVKKNNSGLDRSPT